MSLLPVPLSPNLLTSSSGNHMSDLFFCEFGLFLDSMYKWDHSVSLCLTYFTEHNALTGLPCDSVGKESACNARDCLQCRRPRFDPWIRKIPWRRKWQASPGSLPRKSHGQRSLVGYSSWDCKESDTTEQLNHQSTNALTEVHPCYHKWQDFLLFKIIFRHRCNHIVFIHSPINGHLDCFRVLAIVSNTATNMGAKIMVLN